MIINTEKFPIKIWAETVETGALKQAKDIVNSMPVYKFLALMPDVHQGYGMPIGGVLPLVNAISPNCVGVDIGCGMLSVKTSLSEIPIDKLKEIFKLIRQTIPVGFNHRKQLFPETIHLLEHEIPNSPIIKQEIENSKYQIGTLGGGNHFLEFQQDEMGYIWIAIHSGSRNIGLKIASYYHEKAKVEGIVPSGIPDLAYFYADSILGKEYINAMTFALEFAYLNRSLMMSEVIKILESVMDSDNLIIDDINIHHNYAEEMQVDGEEKGIYLHRKGAVRASKGKIGVIPGSMGSATYIVEGLGNFESFDSCSHGAGRIMSRGEAKKKISKEMYLESLTSIGLEASDREMSIDEAPGAYKNIDDVMNNQNDLVKILHKLMPYKLPAIKG